MQIASYNLYVSLFKTVMIIFDMKTIVKTATSTVWEEVTDLNARNYYVHFCFFFCFYSAQA